MVIQIIVKLLLVDLKVVFLSSHSPFASLKPFQNDKKCLLFYLKSYFRSQDI